MEPGIIQRMTGSCKLTPPQTQSAHLRDAPNTSTRRPLLDTQSTTEFHTSVLIMISLIPLHPSSKLRRILDTSGNSVPRLPRPDGTMSRRILSTTSLLISMVICKPPLRILKMLRTISITNGLLRKNPATSQTIFSSMPRLLPIQSAPQPVAPSTSIRRPHSVMLSTTQ